MTNAIWVFIDQFAGEALSSSWETIGAARLLTSASGGSVTALVIGENVGDIAQEALQYGADDVILADDPSFADFRPEPYSTVLSRQAAQDEPQAILFPTTTRGRELAAMCAVDLDTGVLVDVTSLEYSDGAIEAIRPVYAGKLLAKVTCSGDPVIITIRGRAFPKPELDTSRSGEIKSVAPATPEDDIKTKVIEYGKAEGGVSLNDAGVIVSGGRGVSNNPSLTAPDGMDDNAAEIWRAQQGFNLIHDLAEVLGAAVGASRAAVDAGYIPYINQVGQTGKVVSPDLYIACGISGAIQHLAGMRSSKVIVAINKDVEAPIFRLARFGAVGDLFDIVPELTKALSQRLES